MSVTQEQINKGAKDICFSIRTALENDDGALIGRNGTIELECMIHSLNAMKHVTLENNAVFSLTNETPGSGLLMKKHLEGLQELKVAAIGNSCY